jgi:hypothetical protein
MAQVRLAKTKLNHASYRQLTAFLDDATALLLCQQQRALASSAFAANLDVKRQLDALFLDSRLPVKKVLDGMLATATRVSADLQDA